MKNLFSLDGRVALVTGAGSGVGKAATLALLAAGWIGWSATTVPHSTGPFVVDGLTLFIRTLTLATGAILVLLHWNQADDSRSGESYACLLAILAGVNLVAASNDQIGRAHV